MADKNAQFADQEKGFAPAPGSYAMAPNQYMVPMAQMPMHTNIQMAPQGYAVQGYPVGAPLVGQGNTVVISTRTERSKGPDCCTMCWSVWLLIVAILGLIAAGTLSSWITAARIGLTDARNRPGNYLNGTALAENALNTGASIVSTVLSSEVLLFLLAVFVVVAACLRSARPVVRALNYTAWIIIAICHALTVVTYAVVAIMVSFLSAMITAFVASVLVKSTPDQQQAATGTTAVALGVVNTIAWIAVILALIATIVTAIVAHRNRSRCSCETREVEEDDNL